MLTNSKKKIKNIGIFLKDDDDEEEEEEKENEPISENLSRRGRRTAVLDSKLRVIVNFKLIYKANGNASLLILALLLSLLIVSNVPPARYFGGRKKKATSEGIGVAVA